MCDQHVSAVLLNVHNSFKFHLRQKFGNVYEKQTISNKPTAYVTSNANLILLLAMKWKANCNWIFSWSYITRLWSLHHWRDHVSEYKLYPQFINKRPFCKAFAWERVYVTKGLHFIRFSKLYYLVHNLRYEHKNVPVAAKTWPVSLFKATYSRIYIC